MAPNKPRIDSLQGHYRKACALGALERFDEAADAFDQAFSLSPTDSKLKDQADEMREKAEAQRRQSATPQPAAAQPAAPSPAAAAKPTTTTTASPAPVPIRRPAGAVLAKDTVTIERELQPPKKLPTPVASAFSGDILERKHNKAAGGDPFCASVPGRRFQGSNHRGADVVSFEPVGEAVGFALSFFLPPFRTL